jgi:hypothetical protein
VYIIPFDLDGWFLWFCIDIVNPSSFRKHKIFISQCEIALHLKNEMVSCECILFGHQEIVLGAVYIVHDLSLAKHNLLACDYCHWFLKPLLVMH